MCDSRLDYAGHAQKFADLGVVAGRGEWILNYFLKYGRCEKRHLASLKIILDLCIYISQGKDVIHREQRKGIVARELQIFRDVKPVARVATRKKLKVAQTTVTKILAGRCPSADQIMDSMDLMRELGNVFVKEVTCLLSRAV